MNHCDTDSDREIRQCDMKNVKEVCFIGIAFCGKQFRMQVREHVPFKAELLRCGSVARLDEWVEEMQQAQQSVVVTQTQDIEMQVADSSSSTLTTLSANKWLTFLQGSSSSVSSSSSTTGYEIEHNVQESGKGKKRKKMESSNSTISSEPPIKKLTKK